ncbi:unnamed protein product, partial [Prorocentrum cordatum]
SRNRKREHRPRARAQASSGAATAPRSCQTRPAIRQRGSLARRGAGEPRADRT